MPDTKRDPAVHETKPLVLMRRQIVKAHTLVTRAKVTGTAPRMVYSAVSVLLLDQSSSPWGQQGGSGKVTM